MYTQHHDTAEAAIHNDPLAGPSGAHSGYRGDHQREYLDQHDQQEAVRRGNEKLSREYEQHEQPRQQQQQPRQQQQQQQQQQEPVDKVLSEIQRLRKEIESMDAEREEFLQSLRDREKNRGYVKEQEKVEQHVDSGVETQVQADDWHGEGDHDRSHYEPHVVHQQAAGEQPDPTEGTAFVGEPEAGWGPGDIVNAHPFLVMGVCVVAAVASVLRFCNPLRGGQRPEHAAFLGKELPPGKFPGGGFFHGDGPVSPGSTPLYPAKKCYEGGKLPPLPPMAVHRSESGLSNSTKMAYGEMRNRLMTPSSAALTPAEPAAIAPSFDLENCVLDKYAKQDNNDMDI